MTALIIDDERHARAEMRRLLAAHPEVEIVGEAANSGDALQRIAESTPQLLFLDIQMPQQTGFELLSRLTAPVPQIIFTTAYDEFALRAFEVNALDYLLKPVDPARLAQALGRLPAPSSQSSNDAASPDSQVPLQEGDRVFIREEDRCWFLPVRDIHLLESEGNYTRVHVPGQKPMIYRSLNALEERLPASLFFRANRSQIINLHWIESIEPWFSGGLKLHLGGNLEVEVSRRQALLFRERNSL